MKNILTREKGKGTINLSFVSDEEMRGLNRRFRKKDKPTDVLSFLMDEDGILGDLVISTETTKRNAKKYGVSYKTEVKRLVIHGVLHLLGYDHGVKMRHAEKIYQKF
ncbi:rRNA maturation RNase YbeY [Candidatus Saganbacteria bacterium]|nr:rRNA maturation RNase YbeY [Candidatus Saganbacteria bacterium]